jgi:hypothetical protein
MRESWYYLEHEKPKPEDRRPLVHVSRDGPTPSGWFAIFRPKRHPDLKRSNAPSIEKLVSMLRNALDKSQSPGVEGE